MSSVYLWDLDEGYAAAFLVRKELPRSLGGGVWCAVHLAEVRDTAQSHYVDFKLTSNITVHLEVRARLLLGIICTVGPCIGPYDFMMNQFVC